VAQFVVDTHASGMVSCRQFEIGRKRSSSPHRYNKLYPLTRDIVELGMTLNDIEEMHDRLIVATALQLAKSASATTLLTRDKNIAQSGLVSVAW